MLLNCTPSLSPFLAGRYPKDNLAEGLPHAR